MKLKEKTYKVTSRSHPRHGEVYGVVEVNKYLGVNLGKGKLVAGFYVNKQQAIKCMNDIFLRS